jgi:hypothetical protein
MRFKIFLIITGLLQIHSLFAQKGFEAGAFFIPQSPWILNKTDFDAGDELDYKFNTGFAYGAQLSLGFTYRVGLRVEALVSRQGQRYTTASSYVVPNFVTDVKLDYIQIPVLFRYTGSMARTNSAFQLLAGPQFGVLRRARNETSLFNADVAKNYANNDLSAVVGLGLTQKLTGNLFFQASFRLSYSLKNIEIEKTGREESRNAVAGTQFGLAYVFTRQ